jgi:hypothetical protein
MQQQKYSKSQTLLCKEIYRILLENDAQDLLVVESEQKRLNIMKSLTLLSRYLGCYDRRQDLRQRYSLKWTAGNESLQAMQRFFNPDLNLDVMLRKVKAMMQVLPKPMALVMRHAVLTGLRPSEAVESARLINDRHLFEIYYDPKLQALEHFRFPDMFLRRTKKAFISYITLDNLQPIVKNGSRTPTWNAIRLATRKRGLNMDMRYCRKIYASWLHQCGVPDVMIDLLQGRVGKIVLVKHYLTPGQEYKDRIL